MGFKCGIVGLPNVGKSTLFNALTRTAAAQAANFPFCTIEPNVGEVSVPDELPAVRAGQTDLDQVFFNLLPAPAIAQRDGHRSFGFVLADNIFIQLNYNFRGLQVNHFRYPLLKFFDGYGIIGINTDRSCNLHGGFDHGPGFHIRVLDQRNGSGLGNLPAGADSDEALVRFNDIAVSG